MRSKFHSEGRSIGSRSLPMPARLSATTRTRRAPVSACRAVLRGLLVSSACLAAAAAPRPATAAEDIATSSVVTLTLVPTRIQQLDEIRINTGKKATLADGSYNTVYELKKPAAGNVFLEISIDVAVEPGPIVFDGASLELSGDVGGKMRSYAPIDWFRSENLEEERGERITIASLGSIDATFELSRDEVEAMTLWVGGLSLGRVPEILARIGRQTE